MDPATLAVGVVLGLLAGAVLAWLFLRRGAEAERAEAVRLSERAKLLEEHKARADLLEGRLESANKENAELKAREAAALSRYEEQLRNVEEQQGLLQEAQAKLADTFKALSADTLKESRGELKKDAEDVMKPLRERLEALERASLEMDRKRADAYGSITKQIELLAQQQQGFKSEADKLARALQDTGAAGNWGEMVLERVLEMSGLQEGIHFALQETTSDEDGRKRPDVVVNLPGGRTIVVDSKAPLQAHMSAQEATDPNSRETLLRDHGRKLADHAKALASRGYARRQDTTDFVVLFVPSEAAFRSAFEARPQLVEEAIGLGVFITTPTTLLALLRAVSFGWRQEQASREAQKIQKAGQDLYESVEKLIEHYSKLGNALRQAGNAFNAMGGTIQSRIVPRAARMKELGVQGGDLPELAAVEFVPRELSPPQSAAASKQGERADAPSGLFE
jgi:DNA recombination protein RmuC